MTNVFMKEGNLDPGICTGMVLCKDKGGDWSNLVEAEEHQRVPANHQRQEERHGTDFSLTALKRNQSY